MISLVLYLAAGAGLLLSFCRDRGKTRQALQKAWTSFEGILPQFLTILLLIGLVLAVLSPETISRLLGRQTGLWGVLAAAVIGSITLIPGFVAFPLAAALLQSGAGYSQIAAFASSLMMVGMVTFPLEARTFGKKVALIRNGAAFLFSLLVAFVMGVVM